jgi:peptide deformylase
LHEFDHIDGVLYIDRLSPAKKISIRGKLRRLGGPEE